MRIRIFLFICYNIYFNYAKEQERSAYYDILTKAIIRPYNDEVTNEIKDILKQIWHPKLLLDFIKLRAINQESNPDLSASDSAEKKYLSDFFSSFNSTKSILSTNFFYLPESVLPNSNSSVSSLPSNYSTIVFSTSPVFNLTSNPSPNLTSSTLYFSSSLSSSKPSVPTTVFPENACLADLFDMGHALTQPTNYTWILKMLDSIGKPASGILRGATNWYGSYDECFINIPADQRPNKNLGALDGKYCLTSFSTSNQTMMFGFGDSISITEALCVPSSCSEDFLKELLILIMSKTVNHISFLKNLTVTQLSCPPRSQSLDTRAIGVLSFLGVFLLLMFFGTLYDLIIHRKYFNYPFTSYSTLNDDKDGKDESEYKPNIIENGYPDTDRTLAVINQPGIFGQILLSFSVYSNGAKIINLNQVEGTLSCVHGIRFLSMSWVILGHTFAFGTSNFSDLLNMIPYLKELLFKAIDNAFVSVDSFFLLSGTLVAYSFMKMHEAGKTSLIGFYFHRFWRLTPAYMLTLGTYVSLSKYLGDGPLWKSDGTEINYCANSWWYNILYINNFVSTDKSCMGWSWYLANDMQFYVISPIILYVIVRNKLLGFLVVGILMLATWITSGIISMVYNLPASMVIIENLSIISEYMEKYYSKPYCRIGPYLVGIILGYILHATNCKYTFKRKWIPLLGWCAAIALNMSILYGLKNEPMSNELNALYNSLHRTGWAIGLSWVIFTCVTGYAGFVNTILSWKFWIPLSRLSYCAYLIHPVMMFIFSNNQKYLFVYSHYLLVYLFLSHLIMSYVAAFVISLTFEAPMIGLEKIIFSRNKKIE